MERRRKPPHGACCGCVQTEECACEQGYIVEKIVSSRRCSTCFEGMITVQGIPQGLRAPLRLCSAEVIRVNAMQSCDAPACMPPCSGCQTVHRPGRVMLTLLCCVEDACGCRAEGTACIEVEDCCLPPRPCPMDANLRRGARAQVTRACFCSPCGFHVCADVCLYAIVSRCEMVRGCPKPCPSCPQLPLYPQPHHGCC